MHVGAVMIFDGPAPAYEELADHVRSRLHLVPRFRQKLAFPPLETGRPLWVDDPNFNLEYHVRDTALPSPGSEAQLRALAARVHSQALDRSKPLWEMWLVHGLEGNRFALISKTHHALVDGVSGVDLATVLFDLDADARGDRAPRHAVAAAPDAEPASTWPRAGCAACSGSRSTAARARSAPRPARAPPCTARARRSRASARSCGPA